MFNHIAPMPRSNRARSWFTKLPFSVALAVGIQVSAAQAQSDTHRFKDALEFRGFIRIAGQMEFSIFNKQSQQGEWLRVNQEIGGYKVEGFDPETNSVRVRYQGEVGSLFLQSSQIARYIPPLPVERPPAPPAPRSAADDRRGSAAGPPADRVQSNPSLPALPRSTEMSNRPARNEPAQDWSQFLGGGGRGPGPTPVDLPPPPLSRPPVDGPGGGTGPGGDPPKDDDTWQSTGSPPPLPPTPAPDYSPEG